MPTPTRGKNPVLDYVLIEKLPWGGIPRIAIEAKRMDGEVLPLQSDSSFSKHIQSEQLASIREVICQEGISAIPRGGKHFPECVIITDGDIWEIYKLLISTSESCPDGFKLVKIGCKNNEDNEQPASSEYSQSAGNEPVQEASEASNDIQKQDQQFSSGSGQSGKTGKKICIKLLGRVQLTRDSLVEVAQFLEKYIAPEAVGHRGSGSTGSRLTLKQAYINRGSLPSTKGRGPSVKLYIRMADAACLYKGSIKWPDLPRELLALTESNFGIKIAPFLSNTGFSVMTKSVSPLSTAVSSKPPHTALRSILDTYTLALAIWKTNPELGINPDTVEIELE